MKSVVLIVLDGWGHSTETIGNAIAQAHTPTLDALATSYPFTLLQASGIPVGLPWGESGNSEVGHIALGTGQIRHQPLTRIEQHINDGTFFENEALLQAVKHTQTHSSSLHLVGLLGSGSVHSYLDHLHALVELAGKRNVQKLFLHLFLDGRDSPPHEGESLIEELIHKTLPRAGVGRIATLIGRHYAMDRDLHWDRTEKTYRLIVEGVGERVHDPATHLRSLYKKGESDEMVEPILIAGDEKDSTEGTIQKNDAVVFFNFREDSARQLTYALAAPEKVSGFTPSPPENLFIVTLTEYEHDLPVAVAFPPSPPEHTLPKLIANAGKRQLRVAESEKYAHVTYFFNGGSEETLPGEQRELIPSIKHGRFEEAPQMRAMEISEAVQKGLAEEYDVILANFANADMLGHTGNLKAAVQGVEAVDAALAPLVQKVLQTDSTLVISADHGNAEDMLDRLSGSTRTEHSTNPVPCYIVRNDLKGNRIVGGKENVGGILPDVTATIVELLGLSVPEEFDGTSLLSKIK